MFLKKKKKEPVVQSEVVDPKKRYRKILKKQNKLFSPEINNDLLYGTHDPFVGNDVQYNKSMYYLADFAKREDRPRSLKDNLFGTTSSGKAVRAGALASLAIGAGLVAKNKEGLKKLMKNPVNTVGEHYTTPSGTTKKVIEWEVRTKKDPEWFTNRKRINETPNPSFISSGRNLKWGNVYKTVGVAGALGAVPVVSGYAFADDKDREKISRQAISVAGATKGGLRDLRTWVNTLHRVSR